MNQTKELVNPVLRTDMGVFVGILQLIRMQVLDIKASVKLPESMRFGFMASNFVFGWALAQAWLTFNPATSMIDTMPIQGTFLGAAGILMYKLAVNPLSKKIEAKINGGASA